VSVYVTPHVPEERVHNEVPVKDPVDEEVVNVTVPVGLLPVTIAVHIVEDPALNEEGEHETVVEEGEGVGGCRSTRCATLKLDMKVMKDETSAWAPESSPSDGASSAITASITPPYIIVLPLLRWPSLLLSLGSINLHFHAFLQKTA
jgi:hypothetical protein